MFIEILIFLFLGILAGLVAGFLPGIHPNTMVLFIPLLLAVVANPLSMLVFIVAMAISNVIADFIPSLLFGAADSETSIGVHPGQLMLLQGNGYNAIKLSITGAVGACLLLLAMLPLLIFAVPGVYEITRPFIHLVLVAIVGLMIYDEENKAMSISCFLAAGVLGILAFQLPVDNMMILFPILAGFFGIPAILMNMKNRTEVPEQITSQPDTIPLQLKIKSSITGTFGGIVSGFLPGIGATEVAGIATIDKRKESFLMTLGAIALANMLLSFLAVYLIGKARSGVALAANSIVMIGFNELLIIITVAAVTIGISAVVVLLISKKLLNNISKWNYVLINKLVLAFIIIMIFYFTQFYGIFLAAICTCLGLVAIKKNIKRGLLMGVLIVPTIVFYMGF
ncbi:MAG: tripartite tricarboxylate transporter permease [Candidatus Aenigmarchaeota archaeon]|nr:tripartite tricarboxylate transporter permease [Candidatus Aenigmarchaeota archaeon]